MPKPTSTTTSAPRPEPRPAPRPTLRPESHPEPRPEPRDEPAGPFSAWVRETHRARKLKVIGSNVPCGECNACCRSSYFIHIRPEETAALARIPKRLLFPAPGLPKGHVLMGYDRQGRCPMLADDRCSIYEDRPQTCRDYDCRVFAASGVDADQHGTQPDIARRARAWKFEYPTDADRQAHAAVRAAGAFLTEHRDAFPEGAVPGNPVPLAIMAVRVYQVFLRLNEASAAGEPAPSPAEIARAVLAELGPADPARSAPKKRRAH
ncbi:MAG TPA: YkgJ family cysteine cluster protein [Polyangiaceae bacterium]|nr:YkgJ family cysteine cluster protein [Polyangiaceae bacterium]